MENEIVEIHPQIAQVFKVMFPRTKPEKILTRLEKAMEKDLTENVFPKVMIYAKQKSDRKSLPYQKEIVTSLIRESYLNGMLEYHRCYRKILKELLLDDVFKIRFFVHVTTGSSKVGPFNLGCINYHFRYYVHSENK